MNDKQWKTYRIDFILASIVKALAHIDDETQLAVFKKETEELIDALSYGAGFRKSLIWLFFNQNINCDYLKSDQQLMSN